MKSINIPSLLRMKPQAVRKVGKYLRTDGFGTVAIFWGTGIREMVSEVVETSLESSDVEALCHEVVASRSAEDSFAKAMALPRRTSALLAVGGGLAIDVCKHISHISGLPLVAVPTAISNDGFCSPFSSLECGGHRRTLRTRIPHGVIVDTAVVRDAPARFLYAGMGDLLCKPCALHDWKLALKRTGERYDDFAAIITKSAWDNFAHAPVKSLDNLEFLRIVASSLLMCGVAMEMADSSRPASGSEHLISHAYDDVAARPSLHGLQVAAAAYGVSHLQEQTHEAIRDLMTECGIVAFLEANPLSRKDFIEAIKRAPTVKEDFHSILTEPGNVQRLVAFVESDPLFGRILA